MSFLPVRSKNRHAPPCADGLQKKWAVDDPQEDIVCPSGVVPISSLQSLRTGPAYIPTMVRASGVGNIVLQSSGQPRPESRVVGISTMGARIVTPQVKGFVPTVQGVSGLNHSREQESLQAAATVGVATLSRTEEDPLPISPRQRDFLKSLGVLNSP